jgi:hypothetical protein
MASFASDTLRQEAIKFDGIRSTAAYLAGLLFSMVRVGLFLGGIVLLYDFLHQYHYELVDEVHENIGEFDELTNILPASYPYEYAVAGLIAVALLFLIAGRIRRHLNRPVTRLPGGRLDT